MPKRFGQQALDEYKYQQQLAKPDAAWWVGRFIGLSIKACVRTLWAWRITVLALMVYFCLAVVNEPWLLWTYLLAVIGMWVGAYWYRPLLKFAPFTGDYLRMRAKRLQRKRVLAGNALLVHAGIISPEDDITPFVWLDESDPDKAVLYVDTPLQGVPTQKLASVLDDYKDQLNAVRTRVERTSASSIKVEFYKVEPLDTPLVISEPLALDPTKMRITCAVDSVGNDVVITFGDTSGMVVGGIPGSGKTAGMTSYLLPMAISPHVDMSIIDGKGGEDWTAYAPVVSKYIKGDEVLEPIYDYLTAFTAEMYDRLETLKGKLGTSNYWNATPEERLNAGIKLKLLVIDECQGIFETRKDKTKRANGKTDAEMISEITRMVSSLVKRGRSAGIVVVMATQKPTADSLPTAIRDNAGIRIAFRMKTRSAEEATLGELGEEVLGAPRATAIPADRKGGAVMALDTGAVEMVRFYYMSESDQERVLSQFARPVTVSEPEAESEPVVEGEVSDNDREGGFEWEELEDPVSD